MSPAAWEGAAAFQGPRALASFVLLVAHETKGQSGLTPPLTAAWLQVGKGCHRGGSDPFFFFLNPLLI